MSTLHRFVILGWFSVVAFSGLGTKEARADTLVLGPEINVAFSGSVAISSNEPGWDSLGIFSLSSYNYKINWWDTSGNYHSTGKDGSHMATKSVVGANDTLWGISPTGVPWTCTPNSSPPYTWTTLATVPGSYEDANADLAIEGNVWVVNGDQACDGNNNSDMFEWNFSTSSWDDIYECGYRVTTAGTDGDVVFWAQLQSDGSTDLIASLGGEFVVDRGKILDTGAAVVSMVGIYNSSASYDYNVYFVGNGGDLHLWQADNARSGSTVVTKIINGATDKEIQLVARDEYNASDVYYVTLNEDTGNQNIYKRAVP